MLDTVRRVNHPLLASIKSLVDADHPAAVSIERQRKRSIFYFHGTFLEQKIRQGRSWTRSPFIIDRGSNRLLLSLRFFHAGRRKHRDANAFYAVWVGGFYLNGAQPFVPILYPLPGVPRCCLCMHRTVAMGRRHRHRQSTSQESHINKNGFHG